MAQEIGIVKIVTGTVTAMAADGGKRILQMGDRVYPTDLLTTADGSTIAIQLVDGSMIDMGGNDSMQLGAALQEQGEQVVTAQNPQPTGLSAEEIQAALLAGADPTTIAEATAAGAPAAAGAAGAGNEGHVPVTVEYLNPVAPVTNGFDTIGPGVAFTPIVPEVLILNPGPAVALFETPIANASNVVVDESQAGANLLPAKSGILQIDGQAPASVVLSASGATWDGGTQTLTANDGSYQVTVNNDAYTFTLLKALAHANTAAPVSAPIEFTFSASLTDQNGGVANASFTANVFDDGPIVINGNGSLQDVAGQTLTGLIDYDLGFDGLGGVGLANLNGKLASRSDTVSIEILDKNNDGLQELYAYVDKGTKGLDGNDRAVFSLLPTQDGAADGSYKLVLHDLIDLPPAPSIVLAFDNVSLSQNGQIAVVGNSLLVTGSNIHVSQNRIGIGDNAMMDKGESITYKFGTVGNNAIDTPQLVNSVQLSEINVGTGADSFTWTAYRAGNMVDSKSVNYIAPSGGGYSPAINVAGGYDTLKIEVKNGNFEVGGLKYANYPNSGTLALNFGFTATDGDGDSRSGSFTVDTGALLTTHLNPGPGLLEHPDSIHSGAGS